MITGKNKARGSRPPKPLRGGARQAFVECTYQYPHGPGWEPWRSAHLPNLFGEDRRRTRSRESSPLTLAPRAAIPKIAPTSNKRTKHGETSMSEAAPTAQDLNSGTKEVEERHRIDEAALEAWLKANVCLLYTSPSPRDS